MPVIRVKGCSYFYSFGCRSSFARRASTLTPRASASASIRARAARLNGRVMGGEPRQSAAAAAEREHAAQGEQEAAARYRALCDGLRRRGAGGTRAGGLSVGGRRWRHQHGVERAARGARGERRRGGML